jgi:hypothetical protein
MSTQLQIDRRKQVLEVIYPNKRLLYEKYDKQKIEEYKKIADEKSDFTAYDMNHINKMYEIVMKSKYGIGAVDSKHDPRGTKLRYGK